MRLLAFAHHPIQYQAPIFRILGSEFGRDFHVHFKDGQMGNGAVDPGFGIKVTWDSDVLSGYAYSFRANRTNPLDIVQTLRKYRPDVVLVFLGYNDAWTFSIIAACRVLGIPFAWRFEGSDGGTRGYIKNMSRDISLQALYRSVPAFLSVGRSCSQHLARLGVPEEKVFLSPYNIDDDLFNEMFLDFKKNRRENRLALGINDEDFVFVFCGKMIPRKDPLIILRALEHARWSDKVAVIFLGTGELMPEVESMARRILHDRAIIPGFTNQSQMGRYYGVADASILPSRRETWGLVVNEAMMFDLPVIVSDKVESHLDLITPNETGFVFPEGDAEALRGHMEFLVMNRDESRRMGQAARRRVEKFSTKMATDGIFRAVDYLVRRPPPPATSGGPLSRK